MPGREEEGMEQVEEKREDIENESKTKAHRRRDLLRILMMQRLQRAAAWTRPALFPGLSALLIAGILAQLASGIHIRRQADAYRAETAARAADLAERFPEVNDLYMTERLQQLLTQEERVALTYDLWIYGITVNGVPVTGSSFVPDPEDTMAFSCTWIAGRADNDNLTSGSCSITAPDSGNPSSSNPPSESRPVTGPDSGNPPVSPPPIDVPDNGLLVIVLTETCHETALPAAIARQGSLSRGDPLDTIDRHITVTGCTLETQTTTVEGGTTTPGDSSTTTTTTATTTTTTTTTLRCRLTDAGSSPYTFGIRITAPLAQRIG